MMSLFLNELYGFQLDNHRWYLESFFSQHGQIYFPYVWLGCFEGIIEEDVYICLFIHKFSVYLHLIFLF